MHITELATLESGDRDAVAAEGERLLDSFVGDATTRTVDFVAS